MKALVVLIVSLLLCGLSYSQILCELDTATNKQYLISLAPKSLVQEDTLRFKTNSSDRLLLKFQVLGTVTDIVLYNQEQWDNAEDPIDFLWSGQIQNKSGGLLSKLTLDLSTLDKGWYFISYGGCYISARPIRLELY